MDIVVLAGGLSTERDVSFQTGNMVAKALRENGHKVILLDVFMGYGDKEEELEGIFDRSLEVSVKVEKIPETAPDLAKVKAMRKDQSDCFFGPNVIRMCQMADVVFVALHGENGENGKLQAAFDLLGIRYTGSDYMGSALAMNKGISKQFFIANGIPTPKGVTMKKADRKESVAELGLALPCVVKPCCGGSSIGVTIVRDEKEFADALGEAFRWEDELVIEEYVEGRELSVAIIEGKALPVIEIAPIEGFYDYKNKYQAGSAVETCPADLPEEISCRMQRYAEGAAKALGLDTYCRADFMLRENGEMFCLEVNTLPGMTPTSLLPQEARAVGMSFNELCEKIIAISGKKNAKSMPHMTLENITKACEGTYFGDADKLQKEISGVVIDSRLVEEGYLFIPIRGERVDGHKFIPDVFEKGALAVLSEVPLENPAGPYILVDSCPEAMKKLAAFYRSKLNVKVVGITGSVGKTSTKEMIASVLSQKYEVLKTAGNFNNEIGLPLTIFRIRDYHQVAVLEMGISDFGEMERLAQMARPDICVITNIGLCHLENLKSRDGILQAKTACFSYMTGEGKAVLNGDDDKLSTVAEAGGKSPVFYGVENRSGEIYAAEVRNLGFEGIRANIHTPKGEFAAEISIPGEHNLYNALAATGVGLELGLTLEQIARGIAEAKTIAGRTNVIRTKGFTVIDDCYNANPVSMKDAISLLSRAKGRRIAVLGDMGELGENEARLHYEVGCFVRECEIDELFCTGTLAQEYVRGVKDFLEKGQKGEGRMLADREQPNAQENGYEETGGERKEAPDCESRYFSTRDAMIEALSGHVREGDYVLVKASHFMEFPKVVEALTK